MLKLNHIYLFDKYENLIKEALSHLDSLAAALNVSTLQFHFECIALTI